jgi:hypothetical protein
MDLLAYPVWEILWPEDLIRAGSIKRMLSLPEIVSNQVFTGILRSPREKRDRLRALKMTAIFFSQKKSLTIIHKNAIISSDDITLFDIASRDTKGCDYDGW